MRAIAQTGMIQDTDAMDVVVALTFGHDFNQSLAGMQLPSGLQTLTFGDCFDQSLEGGRFQAAYRP